MGKSVGFNRIAPTSKSVGSNRIAPTGKSVGSYIFVALLIQIKELTDGTIKCQYQ